MRENWDRAVNHVLIWEGGNAIRDNEPGGAVSRGVSLAAFQEEHPGAGVEDLFKAPLDEIKRIYRQNYADKIDFDTLPSGYDAAMLHAAVMFGVNGAKKFDAKEDYGLLVALMMQNKMHREKEAWKFMKGWSDRFVAIYQLAKELDHHGKSPV